MIPVGCARLQHQRFDLAVERPIIRFFHESTTDWILPNVFPFLGLAFARAQDVIEKFLLPDRSALFHAGITSPDFIDVAPNPFTYATRSDKRLVEFLSLPDWDQELGILPEERALLSAHVPATYLLREENLYEVTANKAAFFFKPTHGFASHGVLTGSQVGRGRLRQLLRRKNAYVAQKTVPKSTLVSEGKDGKVTLWTDLRVWAYRG